MQGIPHHCWRLPGASNVSGCHQLQGRQRLARSQLSTRRHQTQAEHSSHVLLAASDTLQIHNQITANVVTSYKLASAEAQLIPGCTCNAVECSATTENNKGWTMGRQCCSIVYCKCSVLQRAAGGARGNAVSLLTKSRFCNEFGLLHVQLTADGVPRRLQVSQRRGVRLLHLKDDGSRFVKWQAS